MRRFTMIIAAALLPSGVPMAAAQSSPAVDAPAASLTPRAADRVIEITPEVEAAIDRALGYLARTQTADGSWQGARGRNTGICSFAVLSFLATGTVPERGRYGKVVSRGVDYVTSCAQLNGLIVQPADGTNGPMYEHAMSTLMLAEVWGCYDRPGVLDRLQRAVDLILASQGDQGGWRYLPRPADADISVTVMQLVALRAAKTAGLSVPQRAIDSAISYVRSCAAPAGGFKYMPDSQEGVAYARSAAGVCSLEACGDYESIEVKTGIKYLQDNKDPRRRGSSEHLHYALYYTAQAMYQAADETQWQKWFPPIRDELLKMQASDGHWEGEAGPIYGTAMSILVLSVPYRYLPVYQH